MYAFSINEHLPVKQTIIPISKRVDAFTGVPIHPVPTVGQSICAGIAGTLVYLCRWIERQSSLTRFSFKKKKNFSNLTNKMSREKYYSAFYLIEKLTNNIFCSEEKERKKGSDDIQGQI